jgi:hypothetical protein
MRTWLPFLLICLLGACSQSINPTDIPGQYEFQYGGKTYVIDVKPDGSYSNFETNQRGLMWSRSGKWTWDVNRSDHKLSVEKFRFGMHLGQDSYFDGKEAYWLVDPERTLTGKLELCFDPDLNDRCFIKTK